MVFIARSGYRPLRNVLALALPRFYANRNHILEEIDDYGFRPSKTALQKALPLKWLGESGFSQNSGFSMAKSDYRFRTWGFNRSQF